MENQQGSQKGRSNKRKAIKESILTKGTPREKEPNQKETRKETNKQEHTQVRQQTQIQLNNKHRNDIHSKLAKTQVMVTCFCGSRVASEPHQALGRQSRAVKVLSLELAGDSGRGFTTFDSLPEWVGTNTKLLCATNMMCFPNSMNRRNSRREFIGLLSEQSPFRRRPNRGHLVKQVLTNPSKTRDQELALPSLHQLGSSSAS